MRYGIKTIIDYSNYGNRYQNYAVQQILNQYGECANVDRKYPGKSCICKYVLWRFAAPLLEKVMPGKNYRYYKCIEFNRFLKYTSADKCDVIFYGSDQIWNPTYERPDFVNPEYAEKKVIALSASVGIDDIPANYEELYREGLKKFDAISVREEAAISIVEKYVDKKPTVLIDPTLYLSVNQWRKIEAKRIKGLPQKYYLLFFLGEISKKRLDEINNLARENNAEVVRAFSGKWNNLSPEEMLYAIDNAELVVTDSFHGTVFSIIFSRPFAVFDRIDSQLKMNSRINNLLKMFNMLDRYNVKLDQQVFDCDFSNVNEVLVVERNKVDLFIQSSLEQKVM